MDSLAKRIAFLTFPVLTFLFSRFLEISHHMNVHFDSIVNDVPEEKIYNFIIVGAGSAGSIIAAKLTDAGERVLLVEAGGPPPPFADIPALSPTLQRTPYDWQFRTVPQLHACKGLINNVSNWPRGRILGGSSRLNSMAYVEGHPEDYRDWFPDYNDFKIEEIFIPAKLRWTSALADAILEGISELSSKKKYKNRLNDFKRVPVVMANGARWSTDRLLTKERLGKGLDVITHAQVEKIIFGFNAEARGISFRKHDRKYVVTAEAGIIVSAGAVGTPKLLMLSGIGPRNHLEELKIHVINDLPVGENLIDHVLTGIDLVTLNSSLSVSITELLKPTSALRYFLLGEGPWTSTGLEVVGTLHTRSINNTNNHPDVQLMVMPVGISQDNGAQLRKYMGISDEVFGEYFSPLAHKTGITLAPVLLHPKSTGEIKLRSKNPEDDPLINPNYLSQEEDVATLIDGLMLVEELVNTKSMKTLGAEMNRRKFPGCEDYEFGGRNYWECYIRHLTLTSYHPAGTCSIGKVVDKNFRVYNTRNLYVVDTSVIPRLPSANINAAVMKLASKAVKLLIDSRRKRSRHFDHCHINDFMRLLSKC
ncbi:glucose dehydrogenase [FAD, quinone] [Diachasma alloeum]|uniref:glucose dehydrogenase [FAD, quinone] n=1 Tax=Diachasma alloeum TaxID=454923 RepID=UPI000738225B|nr:glucose dehydrogenase [FAD, quinone] [Diachasma alloeum]XP_015122040.1 glucose dehydrogenase [FAD, quinone] [Diachasma alloeum]